MLDKTKESLATGITRVKWMASFLAERAKTETSIAKNYYERSKLEKKVDDLYKDIGKRVEELNVRGETDVLQDAEIQRSLREIKDINRTVGRYKTQAENMSKTPKE